MASVTDAVKSINAKNKFALSGTPIENNLVELWSIFDFIMPGYLYNINKFEKISRARYDQMKKDSFDMFEECYTPNGHYDKLMKIYEKAQRKHGE